MPRLLRLLEEFRSDDRGAFIVIFGILAIVLVATAGAVIDFTTIEQSRARAQDALDSAALGLQPKIFEADVTEEQLRVEAQNLLVERLSGQNVAATVSSAALNTSDGSLRLNASIVVPTAFVSLIGYDEVTASLVSEATRKRLYVEVAMVLDNSGSMAWESRMDNLKSAANCATNILFNGDCASTATVADETTVKIGIVPFTELVNVGSTYATASWMDTTGASSIANDNFDDDERDDTEFTGTVNRWNLYNQLSNVSWRGCVEARPYPYDTNDVTPDPLTPDTLFVPEFAPDNPSSGGYDNSYISDNHSSCRVAPTWTWVEVKRNCDRRGNNSSNYDSAYCTGSTTTSYAQTDHWGASISPASTTAPADGSPESYYNDGSCSYDYDYNRTSRNPNRYTNTRTITCEYDFSDREKQERLCKYHGSISTSSGRGPNWDCPTNSLLPLTNTKADVTAAITAMYPQGYTNIHQGTIWGFHMLSPTEPLSEGDDYGTATYKVMIIMTDGENTVDGYSSWDMNRADGYMAYGYPGPPEASGQSYNGRIFSSAYPTPTSETQVLASMNSRTVETCTNAKAAGITIYTIGLNSPNQTTIDMLEACASGPAYSYFPTASSELITVFQDIASQLSKLRLAL